jgi:hypothetical protein
MHMANPISIETHHEAQIITVEIWQSASSAEIMLTMLSESQLFQNSNDYTPQLYLFAASCARRVSHLLQDPRSHQAIRAAELFATNSTTKTQLHHSYVAAQAAAVDIANRYKTSPSPSTDQPTHGPVLTRRTLLGGALLHAAAAASMSSTPSQISGSLQAAETSARYSTTALYYEQLSNDTDSTLISQLIDEEQHRQSQALRIFLGNPFDSERWPPFTIPESRCLLKNRADIKL